MVYSLINAQNILFQYNKLTINIDKMTKKHSTLILFQGILIFMFLFTACVKEGELGLNILPQSDAVVFKYDTIAVSAYTFKADSSYTTSSSSCLLGSTNDLIFGKTQASFLIKLNNSSTALVPKNIIDIDSVVFQIPFTYTKEKKDTATNETVSYPTLDSSYYGNINQNFTFRIYEVAKTIEADTVYYSNMNIDDWYYSGTELAHETKIFNGNEGFLKLMLNDNFMNKFLAADSADFATYAAFTDFFKGFYVKVDEQVSNGGAIFSLNSTSSNAHVTVYYRANNIAKATIDTLSAQYSFGSTAPKVNITRHNYSATSFHSYLNKTTWQDTVTYLQALDGLTTKIIIKDSELQGLQNKVIYDARLLVRLHDTLNVSIKPFELTTMPILLQYSDDGLAKLSINEYSLSTGYTGAVRNKDLYSFNITKYIQDLVDGKEVNSGFSIQDHSPQTSARRSILRSGNNSKPMQIVIKYSDLQSK